MAERGITKVVEVRGLDALHEQLRSKHFMWRPTKELIAGAGAAARKTAQRAAKGRAGKGTLGRAILIDFSHGGLVATVGLPRRIAGIGWTIEEGRRAGRRPPFTPIKRWMIRAGIIPEGKGTSKRVHYMREVIKGRGTRGVHFMAAAEETANKVIRTGIPRSEAEVRALWDRPSS